MGLHCYDLLVVMNIHIGCDQEIIHALRGCNRVDLDAVLPMHAVFGIHVRNRGKSAFFQFTDKLPCNTADDHSVADGTVRVVELVYGVASHHSHRSAGAAVFIKNRRSQAKPAGLYGSAKTRASGTGYDYVKRVLICDSHRFVLCFTTIQQLV